MPALLISFGLILLGHPTIAAWFMIVVGIVAWADNVIQRSRS